DGRRELPGCLALTRRAVLLGKVDRVPDFRARSAVEQLLRRQRAHVDIIQAHRLRRGEVEAGLVPGAELGVDALADDGRDELLDAPRNDDAAWLEEACARVVQ